LSVDLLSVLPIEDIVHAVQGSSGTETSAPLRGGLSSRFAVSESNNNLVFLQFMKECSPIMLPSPRPPAFVFVPSNNCNILVRTPHFARMMRIRRLLLFLDRLKGAVLLRVVILFLAVGYLAHLSACSLGFINWIQTNVEYGTLYPGMQINWYTAHNLAVVDDDLVLSMFVPLPCSHAVHAGYRHSLWLMQA
jgi:hypothetical protein